MSDWRTEEKLRATLARREEEAEDLQRRLDAEREMRVEAEARAERMKEALREVMEWIAAWGPRFVTDPEWDATQAKVDAALAEVGE